MPRGRPKEVQREDDGEAKRIQSTKTAARRRRRVLQAMRQQSRRRTTALAAILLERVQTGGF